MDEGYLSPVSKCFVRLLKVLSQFERSPFTAAIQPEKEANAFILSDHEYNAAVRSDMIENEILKRDGVTFIRVKNL